VRQFLEGWQIYLKARGDQRTRQDLFRDIWNAYHKRILFFIRNMISGESEDLMQDVMLKVYRNLETFNPRYAFSTWIYAIARNHCINELRKHRPDIRSLGAEDNLPSQLHPGDPEAALREKELNAEIWKALRRMQPDYSQMAYLRFYEGLKCREIARIMGIPAGTVKSRLFQIRKTLQNALEHYHED
jgi:RNA polymerase sigma factor (sigma-70 family)